MPECDFHSECAQGELCLVQEERTGNTELRHASTCLSASMETSVEGVACQERELGACHAEPGCFSYSGNRLDLQRRCVDELTQVECIAPSVCNNGQVIGESAAGEVYVFGGTCGAPTSVTFIDHDVDHPLYPELFEVQPNAWIWQECE